MRGRLFVKYLIPDWFNLAVVKKQTSITRVPINLVFNQTHEHSSTITKTYSNVQKIVNTSKIEVAKFTFVLSTTKF